MKLEAMIEEKKRTKFEHQGKRGYGHEKSYGKNTHDMTDGYGCTLSKQCATHGHIFEN